MLRLSTMTALAAVALASAAAAFSGPLVVDERDGGFILAVHRPMVVPTAPTHPLWGVKCVCNGVVAVRYASN